MMKYKLNWEATFSPLLSVYGGEIINVWDEIEDNQLWDLHKNGDGTVQRGREGPADCNIVHWISSRASNEGPHEGSY